MSAKQYPFIDVAVHERVSLPFARGEAVVLFSKDMARVLWSNGRGAALFGQDSIYWDRAMAASVLMMIPILLFYLVFQRWFISSFVGSAVKG